MTVLAIDNPRVELRNLAELVATKQARPDVAVDSQVCDDCHETGRRVVARGRCGRCYQRALNAQKFTPAPRGLSVEERLKRGYREDENGCWVWPTLLKRGGYGQIKIQRRCHLTHRVAYEMFVGPIPDGMQLDHLCRNRACCNPAHLEPVTPRENSLRGVSPAARNAAKTHCHRGHPLSGENLRLVPRGRDCVTCRRAVWQRRNERRLAERRARREAKRGVA